MLCREVFERQQPTPFLAQALHGAGILRQLPGRPIMLHEYDSCNARGQAPEITITRGRRPATLCFPKLINLAEGRDVF